MSTPGADARPGRKPIQDEPKNKRTAQNRAAQRAFRERKERKMKELEDKVLALENEKVAAMLELEFLRKQVNMLMQELANKSGGASSVPSTAEQTPSLFDFPWSHAPTVLEPTRQALLLLMVDFSPLDGLERGSIHTSTSATLVPSLVLHSNTKRQEQNYPFDNTFDEQVDQFCIGLNQQCGTKELPVPAAWGSSHSKPPLLVDSRGGDLLAGLTPSAPLPRYRVSTSALVSKKGSAGLQLVLNGVSEAEELTPVSATTPAADFFNLQEPTTDAFLLLFLDPAIFPQVNYDPQANLFGLEPIGFLEDDPLKGLVTEDLLYDPLGLGEAGSTPLMGVDPRMMQYPEKNAPVAAAAAEVVPSSDDKMLPCLTIWDRVTLHPKYLELDIDGLCFELKSKAKCSEKGAVVSAADVDNILRKVGRP